jgi:hypothetical protein
MKIEYWNLLKLFWRERVMDEDKFDQSPLYACMEISQWNPFEN